MPLFSRPSMDLWYQTTGSGDGLPVLGIMGLAAHADYWSPTFLNTIGQERPFISFDNRGCARSTGSCEGLNMAILADDALELLDHLKIDKAHVIGISMGGMIALTLALRYPSRVASLTIGCSTARTKKFNLNPYAVSPLIDTLRLGGTRVPILFSRQFRTSHPDLVKDFEYRVARQTVSKKVLWEQIKACWSFDVLDRVSQIKAPTLIMTGDRDALMPPECSQELARTIPGSHLEVFPGSGHAFMLENQLAVLDLVTQHWRQAI